MSELPTKEQLKAQKDKEAITAMKLARDNMQAAISRNETLERCIINLSSLIDNMMKHIPEESFFYNSSERNRDRFAKSKADYLKFV